MSNIKLADAEGGVAQAVQDGGVNITMRVSLRELEWGHRELAKIMDKEPSSRRSTWIEDGHTEEELTLLSGLFVAAAHAVPMSSSNVVDWFLRLHGDDALDGFVSYRLARMENDRLAELLSCALRERDLDTLGLERIEAPVRRRTRKA